MLRFVVVGLVAMGCIVRNPQTCLDGLCPDPQWPFCDVNGEVEGKASVCIAVSCDPGAFEACRGDEAITCSAAGNDYDLVRCQLGCDVKLGCRSCTTNDQCANPAPVCDSTTASCRACSRDDECASTVCENGTCVADSSIVYAAPGGSDTSACSKQEPCSISRATGVVVSTAIPPFLRLAPGAYAVGLFVSTRTNAPLRIVATGADLLGDTGMKVDSGANVEIRGVSVNAVSNGVVCGGPGEKSTLVMRDSTIAAGASFTNLVSVTNCKLNLSTSDLRIGASNGSALALSTDAEFDGDRLHFTANTQAGISGFGQRVALRLTNSVIERAFMLFGTTDSSSGSGFAFAFNTIVLASGARLDCAMDSGTPFRTITFDDNIVVGTDTTAVIDGATCRFTRNILFPQPSPPADNVAVDPGFTDQVARNFHLKATSPAVDTAISTDIFPSNDHDFDGVARPQGAMLDVGAFELKP